MHIKSGLFHKNPQKKAAFARKTTFHNRRFTIRDVRSLVIFCMPSIFGFAAIYIAVINKHIPVFGFLLNEFDSFFTCPFRACDTFYAYMIRFCLYLLPLIICGVILVSSLFSRTPKRALRCAFTLISFGFAYLLASAVYFHRDHPEHLTAFFLLDFSLEILKLILILIYTYRILRCMDFGLSKRASSPGTLCRFFSYSGRYFLWSCILISMQLLPKLFFH